MPKRDGFRDPSERREKRRKAKGKPTQKEVTRRRLGELFLGWGLAGAVTYGAFKGWQYLENEWPGSERPSSGEFDKTVAGEMREYAIRRAFLLNDTETSGRKAVSTHMADGTRLLPERFRNVSRYEYVRDTVANHLRFEGVPEPIADMLREELRHLIAAMPGKESNYDNSAESDEGATRLFQIWGPTRAQVYPRIQEQLPEDVEDETMASIVTQVLMVGEIFSSNYETITRLAENELAIIRRGFFGKDDDESANARFHKDFVIPILIDAYHAGEGTLIAAIKHFARECPNLLALEARTGRLYPHGCGLDVFHHLSEMAATEGLRLRTARDQGEEIPDTDIINYGPFSERYTEGVYAYNQLLRDRDMSVRNN